MSCIRILNLTTTTIFIIECWMTGEQSESLVYRVIVSHLFSVDPLCFVLSFMDKIVGIGKGRSIIVKGVQQLHTRTND